MQIKIKLLSDACFSSGEVYNSSVDTDVTYDRYGLPFITAKRLKGCLREVGLELQDWGVAIPLEDMFGAINNKPARIMISDAKLEYYADYVEEIEKELSGSDENRRMLVHPQRVLGEFTYTRSQTRIDRKKGVAVKDSLRVTRVLKKGLIFQANVEFSGKEEEQRSYREALAKCCKGLRCMGMNRTRGMGEVEVSLEDSCSEVNFPQMAVFEEDKQYERLDYSIWLLSPVLFKSILGGQTKTVDYIEGGKILGVVAQRMGNEFIDFMNKGELICSNAYITKNGHRYLPMSASVFNVKNKSHEGREKNADTEIEENEQLSMSRGGYVYQDGMTYYTTGVAKQIRYHHSRPEDKGVGHASTTDDKSQFYQMESLLEGQVFSGSIYGTVEQLRAIYRSVDANRKIRLGYGKNAEYGEAAMTITSLGEKREPEMISGRFVVKMLAPVILYDKNGMYSTEEKVLLETLKCKFALDKLTIVKRFLKYTEIGGYNVTWNEKKPTLLAFDKGTTLLCEMEGPVPVLLGKQGFIGERNSEGYGEIAICEVPKAYKIYLEKDTGQDVDGVEKNSVQKNRGLINGIRKKACRTLIEELAIKEAKEMRVNNPAVVSQLLSILREQDTYKAFKDAIEERYNKRTDAKQQKNTTANILVKKEPKDLRKVLSDSIPTDNELYKWYYTSLLQQLKYKAKRERGVKNAE